MKRLRIEVHGSGLAGLATALAARARGHEVVVVDAHPERAASRVPWAVVHPVMGLRATLEGRYAEAAEARSRLLAHVPPPAEGRVRGVLRLPTHEKQARLWQRRASAWPADVARWVEPAQARQLVPGCSAPWGAIDVGCGIAFPTAPWLDAMRATLDDPARPHPGRARDGADSSHDARHGDTSPDAATVCVEARGHALGRLEELAALVRPVGGVVATFATEHPLPRVLGWRGTIVPVGPGRVQVGATHAPGRVSTEAREEDVEVLRARLLEALPGADDARWVDAWWGTRPATVDHEPVVGRLGPARWVIGGFGARTWLLAPWGAERLVRAMEGEADALPEAWDPGRAAGSPPGQKR